MQNHITANNILHQYLSTSELHGLCRLELSESPCQHGEIVEVKATHLKIAEAEKN